MRLSCKQSGKWWWISSQHCQNGCGSTRWQATGCWDYFDNVMTRFQFVNNRTNTGKPDVKLCQHKLQIHVSVRLWTMKISHWLRENFCNYCKNGWDRNNCYSLHFNNKNYKTNFLLFQTFWMNQKYISCVHVKGKRPLYKHYYYHKINGLKKSSEMRDTW